eukprot:10452996-Alexandrium_andersonii.AAC.1
MCPGVRPQGATAVLWSAPSPWPTLPSSAASRPRLTTSIAISSAARGSRIFEPSAAEPQAPY